MSDTASPAGGNEVTRQYLLDLLREMDEQITALQGRRPPPDGRDGGGADRRRD
jgi:hypothetical protein